jgi:hypothetical protein
MSKLHTPKLHYRNLHSIGMIRSGTRDPGVGIPHEAIERGVTAVNAFEIAICLFTTRVICRAYSKLCKNGPDLDCREQVKTASRALSEMGCWRMCLLSEVFLEGFE